MGMANSPKDDESQVRKDELKKAIEIVRAAGHAVLPPSPVWIKASIEFEESQEKAFRETVEKRGITLKLGLYEAIGDWLDLQKKLQDAK